ncbi:MAG: HAD family hydrolase [Xanthomonadales bacterium]|jgi:putative hydrolase of the HAD superfamily|nr:HAD family hydrolase [Xanthomonadales bacterium]
MNGLEHIRAIAFDADDTLWVNETLFRDAEERFCGWVSDYLSADEARKRLAAVEERNMPAYGYGIKPFTLSLIEAALEVSDGRLPQATIRSIIDNGKRMLEAPVENLPGVAEVLQGLNGHYRLVVATKGDLLDQERKLRQSGLADHFHHIEIVSDKTPAHYAQLVRHLDLQPHEFLMIGNSLRSDILPVLEIGGFAFHVPFHTTWAHELAESPDGHPRFRAFDHVEAIAALLRQSRERPAPARKAGSAGEAGAAGAAEGSHP